MKQRRYGLLGEHLGHSFSKQIHEQLADYTYDLIELPPEALPDFMAKKEFAALNVTIPYKQTVIPYLDVIDPRAASIGAVNTIVNRESQLFGYNTDFDGVLALLQEKNVTVQGKRVLILGTGGTSHTVAAVARQLGAASIQKASRSGKDGALTYAEASAQTEPQIIFNTTPCGMYPHGGEAPIALDSFPALEAVLDAIYNPLRSALVQAAAARGIPAAGGLRMLVAQAVAASAHFQGSALPKETTDLVYRRIAKEKENIVLTGMPGGGKSTVGALLAETTGKVFVDLDAEIVKLAGKSIPALFEQEGEQVFRDLETQVIREFGARTGQILATGGGAILREENLVLLRQNGHLFFIDRPLELLEPGGGRPLAADRDALRKRYAERYDRYCASCDVRVVNNRTPEIAAARTKGVFDEIFGA